MELPAAPVLLPTHVVYCGGGPVKNVEKTLGKVLEYTPRRPSASDGSVIGKGVSSISRENNRGKCFFRFFAYYCDMDKKEYLKPISTLLDILPETGLLLASNEPWGEEGLRYV